MDLSLEDIIAEERKGKAKAEGPKAKARARSTPVKAASFSGGASGSGGKGAGGKLPRAGAAELREMRAFGRFGSGKTTSSQGQAKGKGSWKGDAGGGSTWG